MNVFVYGLYKAVSKESKEHVSKTNHRPGRKKSKRPGAFSSDKSHRSALKRNTCWERKIGLLEAGGLGCPDVDLSNRPP